MAETKVVKPVSEILAERAAKAAKNAPIINAILGQLGPVEDELATLNKKRLDELTAERVKLKRTLESYGWTDEVKEQEKYDAFLKAEAEKAAKAPAQDAAPAEAAAE